MPNNSILYRFRSYILATFILIFIWFLISEIADSPALPRPYTVFLAFFKNFNFLIPHILASTYRVLYSIFLALSTAIPVGLIARKDRIDSIIAPFIYLLYPIPHIVLLPLIILFFGIGDFSRIILISMILFFQILVTTRDAVRNVSRYYILSLRSLGAGEKDIYWHVILPAIIPKILTAMRISIGTAIAVLFFAESFATTNGLGYVIIDSWSRVNYTDLYSGIISMALLGFLLYIVVEILEKRFCRWVD